ncbi:MAG: hypothetical protein MUF87_10225 [Anaerolineae bacterium]|jgi:hypothetical protein|nr:hypothetical protein [Anaerolineae bacterium]
MPAEITWYYPQRLVYERFYGVITLEELDEIQNRFVDHLVNGIAPVHTIIDFREVTDYPRNLMEIRRVLHTTDTGKLGWVIIINQNGLLQFLVTVLTQTVLRGSHFLIVADFESALAKIHKVAPDLVIH